MNVQPPSPRYVGLDECRAIIFGTSNSAPSKRTFAEWKAKRYYPFIKVGKRVFCNPEEVKAALDRRFTIHATPHV